MTHDMAIIGAGIVGASVAHHLLKADRRGPKPSVVMLEAEPAAGYHTTGRSAALYSAGYGPPQVRALTRASRGFFLNPPAGFSEAALWSPRGALFVGGEHQQVAAEREHASLAAHGIESHLLGPDEVRAHWPVGAAGHAEVGVWTPDDFDLNVDALLQGSLRAARHGGMQWVANARVQRLERSKGIWQIETPQGPFAARQVVNAAGAWADSVAALAGLQPQQIEPRRRSAFVFAAPAGIAFQHWPATVALDESWYVKPDAGWLLGSPANADPTHAHDVVAEELDVALGIHRIEEATSLRIRRPHRTWAGLRCFSPDGEPVLGPDPAEPSFWWAAGVGGYGIQSSPAVGAWLAAMLLGEAMPAALAAQGFEPHALMPRRAAQSGPA